MPPTGQDGEEALEWQHHDPRGLGVLSGALWLRRMAIMGLCVCVGAQVESDVPEHLEIEKTQQVVVTGNNNRQ